MWQAFLVNVTGKFFQIGSYFLATACFNRKPLQWFDCRSSFLHLGDLSWIWINRQFRSYSDWKKWIELAWQYIVMTRNKLCIIWITLVQSGHLAGVAIHFLKLWIFLCTKHILDFLLLHFIRKKLLRYVCLQLVSWRTVSWVVANNFFQYILYVTLIEL